MNNWHHVIFIFLKYFETNKSKEVFSFFDDNFDNTDAHYHIDESPGYVTKVYFFFRKKEEHDLFKLVFDQVAITEAEDNEFSKSQLKTNPSLIVNHQGAVTSISLATCTSNSVINHPSTFYLNRP